MEFLESIRKGVESIRAVNKNATQFRSLLFWPGGRVKGCNTLLWKLTCFDLRVLQDFQDKPNFSGVFKKAFPQPPCLFFSRTDH